MNKILIPNNNNSTDNNIVIKFFWFKITPHKPIIIKLKDKKKLIS